MTAGMDEEALQKAIFDKTMEMTLGAALVSFPVFLLFYGSDQKKKELYLKKEKASWPWILLAGVIGVFTCVTFNLAISILANFMPEAWLKHFSQVAEGLNTGGALIQMVAVAIVGPIIEELVFRGLVYQRLKELGNKQMAAFVSAFLFGVFHGNIIQGIYAFVLGLFLAVIYERTNTILAPMAFHIFANGSSLVLNRPMDWLLRHSGFWSIVTILVGFVVSLGLLKIMRDNLHLKEEKILPPNETEGETYTW